MSVICNRHGFVVAASIALGIASSGCVGTIYAARALDASSSLEQGKVLKADELAEFEYYYATEMLLKAQEEAAEASYGEAIEFAGIAQDYAEKAIELSKDAHKGAGR